MHVFEVMGSSLGKSFSAEGSSRGKENLGRGGGAVGRGMNIQVMESSRWNDFPGRARQLGVGEAKDLGLSFFKTLVDSVV